MAVEGQLQAVADGHDLAVQVGLCLLGEVGAHQLVGLVAQSGLAKAFAHAADDAGHGNVQVSDILHGLGQLALGNVMAGLVASFWMAVIYIFLCNIGASSVSVIGIQENGAPVLAKAAYFYFGQFGSLLLAAIVFLACITTSIGLVSSCAAYFSRTPSGEFSPYHVG